MYTKETILNEIHEIAKCPMTMERTEALAFLLYIKEHCHELHGEAKPAADEQTDGLLCKWVDQMENADGTTGPHWSRHEAEVIQGEYGILDEGLDFYVALNMMYSDYCTAAVQAGCATVELFARMAVAFLNDKDAQPDKLERYYRYIAAHK